MAVRLSPPGLHRDQGVSVLRRSGRDRHQVGGDVVADRGVRAAAGLHGGDQSSGSARRAGGGTASSVGVDVVGSAPRPDLLAASGTSRPPTTSCRCRPVRRCRSTAVRPAAAGSVAESGARCGVVRLEMWWHGGLPRAMRTATIGRARRAALDVSAGSGPVARERMASPAVVSRSANQGDRGDVGGVAQQSLGGGRRPVPGRRSPCQCRVLGVSIPAARDSGDHRRVPGAGPDRTQVLVRARPAGSTRIPLP